MASDQYELDFEIWKPVPFDGWPFEVSSFGRVRRLRSAVTDSLGRKYVVKEKILTPTFGPGKYLKVCLRHNGEIKSPSIHTLVCRSFRGSKPSPLHHAAHNDGNKYNNHLYNILWKTMLENNSEDAIKHGSHRGDRNGRSIITSTQVSEIKILLREGLPRMQIARRYGVGRHVIARIARGENWTHVE